VKEKTIFSPHAVAAAAVAVKMPSFKLLNDV